VLLWETFLIIYFQFYLVLHNVLDVNLVCYVKRCSLKLSICINIQFCQVWVALIQRIRAPFIFEEFVNIRPFDVLSATGSVLLICQNQRTFISQYNFFKATYCYNYRNNAKFISLGNSFDVNILKISTWVKKFKLSLRWIMLIVNFEWRWSIRVLWIVDHSSLKGRIRVYFISHKTTLAFVSPEYTWKLQSCIIEENTLHCWYLVSGNHKLNCLNSVWVDRCDEIWQI
jgi:hypothetical protein